MARRQTRKLVLGFAREGGGPGELQVNSEQVGLESLAEAGEHLRHPDMSRELIPALQCQNREELGLGRTMLPVFSEGGTSRLAKVVEQSALAGV